MSGYCGILLALAAAAAGDEARVQPLPATATAVNEAGNTYREQSRQAIREVLARREFADLHADPYAFLRMISNWVERFVQRANDLLKGLPEWLFWTVLVWMLLTLAAILAHLIYTLVILLRGTSPSLSTHRKGRRIGGELLGIKDLDFDTVYAEARRLLTAGDWPAATRYFYVAAILWLDRQGWIVFKRSKTNRDYIDELASRRDSRVVPPTDGRFRTNRLWRFFAAEFHDSGHRHYRRRSAP